jgi:indole-3-glycerol phosphate synthase
MKNILDSIIENKKLELRERKAEIGIDKLEESPMLNREPMSLKKSLLQETTCGVIAEFKKMSPSAGWLKRNGDPAEITRGYVHAGAAALSVLTDRKYFAGSMKDLTAVRQANRCPILRKDFMIDEYQVLEARAAGADAILLIAAVLGRARTMELAKTAASMGLEVILEVHDAAELDCLNEWIDMVGVNNRNLKRMETDVGTSVEMAGLIPEGFTKISESGIHDPETIVFLRELGYRGFLIGEYFMKQVNPAAACRMFMEHCRAAKSGK